MSSMIFCRLLFICCVIYSVIWPSSASHCGIYERPVECKDFCQTCKYKNGGCAQPAVCIPGCDCIPGFLRNEENECIPAALCPDQCKDDEQYYSDIPDCKNTCENYNNPGAVCPQYYAPRPGCFCKKKLVKRKDGKCVNPVDCFPQGIACLQEKDPGPCYGSFPRFYYNKWTRQCEKFIYGGCGGNSNNFLSKQICEITCKGPPPPQCPPGEIPVKCIDFCQRCEYINGNCTHPPVCIPGCNCLPGFFRDKKNKCIPKALCPDQCKDDEQYYPDIPDCKNTCENYNNPGAVCPQYFAPRPGCFCKKNLVKRKDGKCVYPEDCFPPGFACLQKKDPGPCYGNFERFYYNILTGQCEKFTYGGCKGNLNNFLSKQDCEIECKDTGPYPPQNCPAGEFPVECIDRCQKCKYKNGNCVQIALCTPGCDCLPGFLRDETNKCIPKAWCP